MKNNPDNPLLLVDDVVTTCIQSFQKSSLFYIGFFLILAVELLAFVICASSLVDTFFIGIALAIVFFTLLVFSILRLYFEEELPERFIQLRDTYLEKCKKMWGYKEGSPASYLHIANALFRPVAALQEQDKNLYRLPYNIKGCSYLQFLLEALHRSDLLAIKELFLQASIAEHIKLVRCEPTNLEIHAALANAYVMLSSLYQNQETVEAKNWNELSFWMRPSEKTAKMLQAKFRSACQKAMEEFSILKEYAPHDPWVHTQLAYSFRDLGMSDKEIQEYEILADLQPQDNQILYKLGLLYFEQGHNAKGLQVYERLKNVNFKKAEDLIQHYGSIHNR